jgi:NADH-quinone oxidoreductase subunit G
MSAFSEILKGGKNAAILLGNFAQQHPQAAAIHAAAQAIGAQGNIRVGFLGEAANSVGGYVAGLPAAGGMPEVSRKSSLVLMGLDAHLDLADPNLIKGKQFIVNLTSFKSDVGDVLLPIAPFTETPGTFVSTEGRVQGFHAAVRPLGDARPAWKVLRVLGTMLGLPGFELDDADAVRASVLPDAGAIGTRLRNGVSLALTPPAATAAGVERVADVPIYFADPLVRSSVPLQKTKDALPPRAWMSSKLAQKLGVAAGHPVLANGARLTVGIDEGVPEDCVRLAAGHRSSTGAGPMFGTLTIEKVAVGQAA